VVAPLVARAVNNHDNLLFNESFFGLLGVADLLDLNLVGTHLTLDAGFDAEANRVTIRYQGLVPVIKPNPRGTRDPEKLEASRAAFEPYAAIYKERYKVERCFAWEDTYRKLVIRYEKLRCTHLGFKYLAYSMVNLRWFIKRNRSYSL